MNKHQIAQLKNECPHMATFLNNNPKLQKQPIFQGFLRHDEYRSIFIQAICSPSSQTLQTLDDAFKTHYANVQFTQYLSKTLYWTSVQYDRKRREHDDKQLLTVDKPYAEPLYRSPDSIDLITETADLGAWSEDPNLTNALNQLTQKQQTVIIERYGKDRTNSDIARLLNVSPQAVSKTHTKALARLRFMLKKDVEK